MDMSHRIRLGKLAGCLLALACLLPATTRAGDPEEGFVPLFNGRDLSGWAGREGWWSVQDGAIVGESTPDRPTPTHYLYWQGGQPSDFELRVRYRILGAGANSGIHIRSAERPDFDIWGYQADFDFEHEFTGCLFQHDRGLVAGRGEQVVIAADGQRTVERFADAGALLEAVHDEDWNEYRIRAEGPHITLWINDVLMCKVEDHQLPFARRDGHIALQMHQGPPMRVEFKDLRIKEF